MWLGLSPIEPGTCLSHGIWDFSDSLCCVTNCWCREGRGHEGPHPAALVTAHCPKVGNSLVCLDIKHVESCCQSAYKCMSYLSLVAFSSCLCIAFWSWYEETCFPLWREACTEEIVSQSKQKSWIRGFWLAFPLSWVFSTLFFWCLHCKMDAVPELRHCGELWCFTALRHMLRWRTPGYLMCIFLRVSETWAKSLNVCQCKFVKSAGEFLVYMLKLSNFQICAEERLVWTHC